MVSRKEGEDELPDLESFDIVLGQGCIFGRCCKIAVSSEDGKRRLFAYPNIHHPRALAIAGGS